MYIMILEIKGFTVFVCSLRVRERHSVDLRLLLRLRQDQRRLPFMSGLHWEVQVAFPTTSELEPVSGELNIIQMRILASRMISWVAIEHHCQVLSVQTTNLCWRGKEM